MVLFLSHSGAADREAGLVFARGVPADLAAQVSLKLLAGLGAIGMAALLFAVLAGDGASRAVWGSLAFGLGVLCLGMARLRWLSMLAALAVAASAFGVLAGIEQIFVVSLSDDVLFDPYIRDVALAFGLAMAALSLIAWTWPQRCHPFLLLFLPGLVVASGVVPSLVCLISGGHPELSNAKTGIEIALGVFALGLLFRAPIIVRGNGVAFRAWSVVAFLAFTAVSVWGVASWSDYRLAFKSARDLTLAVARLSEEHVDRTLDASAFLLDRTEERIRQSGLERTLSLRHWENFSTWVAAINHIAALGIVDPQGRLRLLTSEFPLNKQVDVNDREYVFAHHNHLRHDFIGPVITGRVTSSEIFAVSRQIRDDNNDVLGIAFSSLEVSYFREVYRRLVGSGGLTISLYRGQGDLLVREPAAPSNAVIGDDHNDVYRDYLSEHSVASLIAQSPVDGNLGFKTFAKVAERDLFVVVTMGLSDVLAQWQERFFLHSVSMMLVLALVTALTIRHLRNLEREEAGKHALMESEKRFRFLTEHGTDVVSRLAADGTLLYVSAAISRHLGWHPSLITGTRLASLCHPEDVSVLDCALEDLGGRESFVAVILRLRAAQGDYLWVEGSARATIMADGSREIVMTMRNIHDRKQAEQAVEESRRWFCAMVDAIPAIIFVGVADDIRLEYVNKVGLEYAGLPEAEILAQGWRSLVHPDDIDHAAEAFATGIVAQSQFSVELRLLRRDGTYRWHLATGVPRFEDGNFRGHVGLCSDITDLRDARETLMSHATLLQAIIEAVPEAMVLENENGNVIFANSAVGDVFHYRPEELLYRRNTLWSHLQDVIDNEMATGTEQLSFVASYRTRHGIPFIGDTVIRRIRNLWGDILGTLKIVRDISEPVSAARQIHSAKAVAETANAAKTRFLAAISHDLRQPLHAIGLFVDALAKTVRQGDEAVLVRDIQRSLASVEDMFGHLLDVSRLESGDVPPKIRPIPARILFDRVLQQMKPFAAEKGLSLRAKVGDAVLYTDPVLCERILRNLISNALRYTLHGGVVLGCRKRGEGFSIEVWDSGIGIDAADLDSVFLEFFRVKGGGVAVEGLGLGLPIVRRLCDLLGHPLTVQSRPGAGSVFKVAVAAAPTELVEAVDHERHLAAGNVSGANVVLLDDDPAILASTEDLFKSWGCHVRSFRSLAEVKENLGSAPVDLVVTDYRLADSVTGLDVVEWLRQDRDTALRAIIITGDTAPALVEAARNAGCRLLHKPLRPSRLRSMVALMLNPLS